VSFASATALIALLAIPLLALLLAYAARRRREAIMAFAGQTPTEGAAAMARVRRWRAAMTIGGAALVIVALAGPRYGVTTQELRQDGVDLMIALDVSRSMLAEDVAPSRLDRARRELNGVLDNLAGSRVGVVLFAGEAFLQCPLTSDLSTVRRFLAMAEPDLVPTQGTDIGEAIRLAAHAFSVAGRGGQSEEEPRARVVLVVSDGEDHLQRIRTPLVEAENDGIVLFAAGIGSPDGAPISLRHLGRPEEYHTDRQGQTVMTRLEEESLQRVGRSGAYFPITPTGGSLDPLPDALARLDRGTLRSERTTVFAERYQWPLGLALLLLVTERLIVPSRRKRLATA